MEFIREEYCDSPEGRCGDGAKMKAKPADLQEAHARQRLGLTILKLGCDCHALHAIHPT
jgi:hypothetical protein